MSNNDVSVYPTREVKGIDLNHTHVLVGESGGLSAVYDNKPSSAMPSLQVVETEHGFLYLDPACTYPVLDPSDGEDNNEEK